MDKIVIVDGEGRPTPIVIVDNDGGAIYQKDILVEGYLENLGLKFPAIKKIVKDAFIAGYDSGYANAGQVEAWESLADGEEDLLADPEDA